jgi:7,8-dihydroneopterin aldolase/epimerase/oxygenase
MNNSSLAKLSVDNIDFYAYHGVKKEEKKLGGKFEIDVDLWYNPAKAVAADDINFAVNYEEVVFCVSEVMNGESYNLIETLANEILNMIFDKLLVVEIATVRVRKLAVPMRRVINFVETELTFEREQV